MKKGKIRSEVSLQQTTPSCQDKEAVPVALDVLTVKVLSLRTPEDVSRKYAIEVSFCNQTILMGIIQSEEGRTVVKKRIIARGFLTYDPSDYPKMSIFADYPLTVIIQPIEYTSDLSMEQSQNDVASTSIDMQNPEKKTWCCNVDILSLFISQDKLKVTRRMEPIVTPKILEVKSWNNLPEISMEISVLRNEANTIHHKVLQRANTIKITVIGAYNMFVPLEDDTVYTAATKIPMISNNEMNSTIVTYDRGYEYTKRFNSTSFYPKWESLRTTQLFTKCDEKFECKVEDLINAYNIHLEHYLNEEPDSYITLWGSFHRSLMLKDSETWLSNHLRRYNWPFELQVYSEYGGYSFTAFLDLFRLLYPGENSVRLITPLQWTNRDAMLSKCGCELLLHANDRVSSTQGTFKKPSKGTTDSAPTSISTDPGTFARPTGGDDNNAFVIVEVKLARPLRKPVIPPHISTYEIKKMLEEMEEQQIKRECTGRGQLKSDWQATIKSAVNSLRRTPYYGMTDICAINRQLSETRNRVEIITSFWQEAAIYVNNNFIPQQFLSDENIYEEMLMMAHACLMRTARDALVGTDNEHGTDPMLKAARHARQLRDVPHAVDLFLQLIAERPRDADLWRELATCLRDMDMDCAVVCINKSLKLNLRHPLTLLSKACMVFEEDPDGAEPFFLCLLTLCPFWSPMWVAVSAYYLTRHMFEMAHELMECVAKTSGEGLVEETRFLRTWQEELGDWWDDTPLLPGTSLYYEAADLLLRIRAVSLAEVCISRAVCQSGLTAAHFHLVALCCRLSKRTADALTHLQLGIEKFGNISYLRSLEAECHHRMKNIPASTTSFEMAGTCSSAYSILLSLTLREPKRARSMLVDLIRRQPSAYAWMAMADDWMKRSTCVAGDADKDEQSSSAAACAVQALRLDRGARRAWSFLAKLVKPSARRQYCNAMGAAYGYTKESDLQVSSSKRSLCCQLGTSLRECRCEMCEHLTF